jgi:ABC-2 type transport system ATP-binding protein
LQKIHKFQAAFDVDVKMEDFDFACMSYSKTGRVVRLIARGEKGDLEEKIRRLSPIFVEEIDVDFEERFIGEVESRGYLK